MYDATHDPAQDQHPDERHARWCDPWQHAGTLEWADRSGYCVSAPIERGQVGGWLIREEDGPQVVVEWSPTFDLDPMTPQEAVDLIGFLAAALAECARH